jgi:hypothetical protein
MASALATYEHAEIVRIAHESESTAAQLPIELVEDDIRKEW